MEFSSGMITLRRLKHKIVSVVVINYLIKPFNQINVLVTSGLFFYLRYKNLI